MPVEGSFFLLSLRDCLVGKVIKGVGRLEVTGGKGERKNNYYLPLYGGSPRSFISLAHGEYFEIR